MFMIASSRLQLLAGVALVLGACLGALGEASLAQMLIVAGIAWGTTTSAPDGRPPVSGQEAQGSRKLPRATVTHLNEGKNE